MTMQVVDDNDMAFADLWNQQYHSFRGNYVFETGDTNALKVTANTSSDLTNSGQPDVDVNGGYGFTAGNRTNLVSGSLDLSTEYALLSPGQSVYVYIYVDSSGVLQKLAGAPAASGQQYPPDFSLLPTDCVVLARVVLTYGDTQVNNNDIKDLRLLQPRGIIFKDNDKLYLGNSKDLQLYHSGSHSYMHHQGVGALIILDDASTGMYLYTHSSFRWRDRDDSDVVLMELNTDTRNLIVGGSTDLITTKQYGELQLMWMTGAEGGQLNFKGDGSTYLNDFYIDRYANKMRFIYNNSAVMELDPEGNNIQMYKNLTLSGQLKMFQPLYIEADSIALSLGAGHDFYVYHDGANNIFKANTGRFYFQGPNPSTSAWIYGTKLWSTIDGSATYVELIDASSVSINPTLAFYPRDGSSYYGMAGIIAQVQSDLSGTLPPAFKIDGRLSGSQLTYRPLFAISNYGTTRFQVEADGSITNAKQIYAYPLWLQQSSTVTATQTTVGSAESSLVVLDNVSIPLGDVLPRGDYTIKAGVYVTNRSGDTTSVRVQLLKAGIVVYDSDYIDVTSTGTTFLTVASNASFQNDRYAIKLWVKATYNTSSTTITARLDNVSIYV